ncbi:MAG: Cro/Cl family transcriptional regulator [Steroidobacteraceae bacterium]|nr:Cro/Cl family transcriptional regulator [Steroidobacteraceae bacterium]
MKFTDALEFYGSRNKIAKALGCTRQNITRWQYDGIPLLQQYRLEEITRGKLKRVEPPIAKRSIKA